MENTPAVNRRTPWGPVVSLVAALLYGASPIDLLPDVLVLIGWVDDVVVFAILGLVSLVGFARWNKRRKSLDLAALPPK